MLNELRARLPMAEDEGGDILCAYEFAGKHGKVAAECGQSHRPVLWRQAQALEPVHESIGEKQRMEVRFSGGELTGGDLGQRRL